jgi:hypothetical protein
MHIKILGGGSAWKYTYFLFCFLFSIIYNIFPNLKSSFTEKQLDY